MYPERNIWHFKNIGISHWTNRERMHRWDFVQTSEQQSQKWSQSLSVGHLRTVRLVEEFGSLSSSVRKIQVGSQKMSKSGFFGNDKKSQFSLIVEQRFKTRVPSWLWQKYLGIEWNYRVSAKRSWSCSCGRWTTSTRSTTSSWTVTEAKLGSSWSSCEKSQLDGRIEAIFKDIHSTDLREFN